MSAPCPDFMSMLSQLIGSPSVSSTQDEHDMGNREIAGLLATWLADLGFDVELLDVPDRKDKVNLIATLGAGPGGLVLSGHMDTVPCDPKLWTTDPWQLDERDDRLYGLGTADMKAFFAIAIEAATSYLDSKLREPLILLATADEESSMHGAKALEAIGRPRGRYAVIGEPTGLRPVRMHKGILMERVAIQGQSGHSSNPALGVNALECMHSVIAALLSKRAALQSEYRHDAFEVPEPTLNLGSLHGGDNPNRICGSMELQYDLRTLPGMQLPALRSELHELARTAAGNTSAKVETESLFEGIDAFELDADSDLTRTCEQLTGHPAEAVAFATEAPFLARLGMQTIVLGPGDIEQAHQPDEFIRKDRIAPCTQILRELIGRYCV